MAKGKSAKAGASHKPAKKPAESPAKKEIPRKETDHHEYKEAVLAWWNARGKQNFPQDQRKHVKLAREPFQDFIERNARFKRQTWSSHIHAKQWFCQIVMREEGLDAKKVVERQKRREEKAKAVQKGDKKPKESSAKAGAKATQPTTAGKKAAKPQERAKTESAKKAKTREPESENEDDRDEDMIGSDDEDGGTTTETLSADSDDSSDGEGGYIIIK